MKRDYALTLTAFFLFLASAAVLRPDEAALAWMRSGDAGLAGRLMAARAGLAAALILNPVLSFWLGLTAAGVVFAAQARRRNPEPGAGRGWALVSGLAALPPVSLWILSWVAGVLGNRPPFLVSLLPWFAGVLIGLAAAFVWLRYGAPALDLSRHRLAKRAATERNQKTDIREINKMLPAEIGGYDPGRYMSRKDGVFVGLDEDRRPVKVDLETWRLSHVLLSGRTRAGKGVAAQILLSQAVAQRELVVVLDPKGDEWLPHVLHAAAARSGVPYRFVDLRDPTPQLSLFSNATEAEIETVLIAGFSLSEKGEAADFYRLADRKAAREAAARLATGKPPGVVLAEMGEDWLARAAGFHALFLELVNLRAVCGATDWLDMAQAGGVWYVVGDALNPAITRVQRMIAVRLLLLAKRLHEQGEQRQVCLFADEFKWHISRPFMAALGMAAGWGLHCVLAFQSLQDLADCPADLDKEAVRGAVMENCAIQLSYAVKDPETAEWLARSTGKIQVDDEMRRVERNLALSETVLPERTIRQSERYFIDENMFLMLPKACAVLTAPGQLARFVFTSPVKVEKDPAARAIVATGGSLAVENDAQQGRAGTGGEREDFV
ncbi:MAG: type IV secretory system conjugative DNA transfer family protein [Rhodocyclaceae bacterium]|nr:type IV secretory system conjugative DNA transfer family protein [Rhodocyclaceae bacterium]